MSIHKISMYCIYAKIMKKSLSMMAKITNSAKGIELF